MRVCRRSVYSRDVSVVVSVCEFLADVVFQDFPAEVFLQRPSIVKVALSVACCLLVASLAVAMLCQCVAQHC